MEAKGGQKKGNVKTGIATDAGAAWKIFVDALTTLGDYNNDLLGKLRKLKMKLVTLINYKMKFQRIT